MAAPRPMVLVPGACLGGWAWDATAARLRALGHDVRTPTLTGLGPHPAPEEAGADLETHIADVVRALDEHDLEDVVLVGHSYAGTVVTGAADRRPERLGAVVYLDTGPLPDGTAIVDLQTPEQRARQRREVDEGGGGRAWPVPDRRAIASGAYGSAAGLTDDHYRLLAERGAPHPYASFTQPLRLTHERPPGVRRAVILCRDGGMSIEQLRGMIDIGYPIAAVFAAPDWEIHEIDTGHWAMLTAPGDLAELLHDIAGAS